MAKLSNNRMAGMIVILLLFVVLAGFIVSFYDHTQGQEIHTLELEEGETATVKPPLQTTFVDKLDSTILLTVSDYDIGESSDVVSIAEGDTETLSIRSYEVNVTNIQDIGGNFSMISYEMSVSYAWDDISILYVGALGLIVLGLFVWIIIVTLDLEET